MRESTSCVGCERRVHRHAVEQASPPARWRAVRASARSAAKAAAICAPPSTGKRHLDLGLVGEIRQLDLGEGRALDRGQVGLHGADEAAS